MGAGTIAPTEPYCRACGWDFVRVETGADGICDSCGDLLVNSEAVPVPATGATAGSPGTWTPAPAIPAANFAGMGAITASPTSPWLPGQHMVLGDASQAYWDGTAWQVGAAPAYATTATAGIPGTFGVGQIPLDFAGMTGVVATPLTLWTIGQSVQPYDASDAYWDSAAWQVGTAP